MSPDEGVWGRAQVADGRCSRTGKKSLHIKTTFKAESEVMFGVWSRPVLLKLSWWQVRKRLLLLVDWWNYSPGGRGRGRWERKSGREDVCSPAFCSDFTLKLFGRHSTHRNKNHARLSWNTFIKQQSTSNQAHASREMQLKSQTRDHDQDSLKTCGCMTVRAGMRSRVAQAGRQTSPTEHRWWWRQGWLGTEQHWFC